MGINSYPAAAESKKGGDSYFALLPKYYCNEQMRKEWRYMKRRYMHTIILSENIKGRDLDVDGNKLLKRI
jgi:hypothetical protein